MTVDLMDFYETQILPRVDRLAVFQPLSPRDKGNYISANCPGCNRHSGFIYKNGTVLKCSHETSCGYSASILTFMNDGVKPTGPRFVSLLKQLADSVGLILPEKEYTKEQLEEIERVERIASNLESLVTECQASLANDSAIRGYLADRGINHPEMHGLGLYLSQNLTVNKELGTDERWDGRLVIPIRDRHGRLRGVQARDTAWTKESTAPKYLFSKGLDIGGLGLLGLDVALSRPESKQNLYVTEGIMDVFLFRERKVNNIACIGSNTLSADRLKLLSRWGVQRITVMPDYDTAGFKGLLSIIEASNAIPSFTVSVIDPSHYGDEIKDPAEYLQVGCPVDELLAKAQNGRQWQAQWICDKYECGFTDDRVACIDEAIKVDELVTDPRKSFELAEYFWPVILDRTGASREVVLNLRDERRETRRREREKKLLRQGLTQALENIEGDYDKALNLASEALDDVSQDARLAEPIVCVADELWTHREKMEKLKGREYLGLTQQTLKTLDDYLLGLRGLILLAAQPNVGKTILACQLALDVLRTHEDACVLYISLDMPRDELETRCLCRLSHSNWIDFVRGNDNDVREGAYSELADIGKRLIILDRRNCSVLTSGKVLRELANFKAETGCKRAFVVVDYVQLWPIPSDLKKELRNGIDRDQWRFEQMQAIKDALEQDPVFVISEARKPNQNEAWASGMQDVMGTARGAYSPDVILLLNPFTNQELIESVEIRGEPGREGLYPKDSSRYNHNDEEELTKKEQVRRAKSIRSLLAQKVQDYATLKVDKVRDGGTKGNIILTTFWRQARFAEGIH